MSPAVMWCQNRCLHCWRATEFTVGTELKPNEVDKPSLIIEKSIEAQRRQLSGFGGNPDVNKKKFEEAQEPKHFAISLAGEPTIYPLLDELIKELRKRGISSFLVTNGLLPERLQQLVKNDALPTQLYISMNAPDKESYKKFNRSLLTDAWEKFNKSLELMRGMQTRRVIRITAVRGLNMHNIEGYVRQIEKAMPDFIEVKAFMAVGYARKRLGVERMPTHAEVKAFAGELASKLHEKGYKLLDEKEESRVVLIGKNKEDMKIKKI